MFYTPDRRLIWLFFHETSKREILGPFDQQVEVVAGKETKDESGKGTKGPKKSLKSPSSKFTKSAYSALHCKKFISVHQKDPRDPRGILAFEFDRIDRNRDGWLSRAELHQGLLSSGWDQDEVCGLFEQIDVDMDGQITKDEYISHRSKSASKARGARDPTGFLAFEFDRIDKNKDGALSFSELHQGLLSAGWGQDDVCRLFDLMDADGDGRVTKDEFIAFKSASFV